MKSSQRRRKESLIEMKKTIKKLRHEKDELKYILNYKIKSAKAYKLWQSYNLMKKLLRRYIYITFLLLFIPIYFLIISFAFVIYRFICLLLAPLRKNLELKENENRLDGVSIVIPSWNKKNLILNCVEELDRIISKEELTIPKEIIVIDNGSTDGTYEALLKVNTKTKLSVIKLESNLGFARAINKAAVEAQYNYLYLLNNDMIPQDDFFSSLISFARKIMKKNKSFFGISSQIFFYDPKKRREESGKTYFKPFLGYMYVAHSIVNANLIYPSLTAYVGGGSSLINKTVFLKLGGYDHASYKPLYVEDLDLSFIAWKKGFASYFLPDSKIIHHHRSSSKQLKQDPSYYMYKNWLVFILKNTHSLKMFLEHLFLYPLLILSDFKYTQYAFEGGKNILSILLSKIRLSKYSDKYTDSELFNFIEFEAKYGNKY